MKMLLLALTLLVSTALLQAQDQAPQGQSPQATPQDQAPQAEQPQDQTPSNSRRMGQMGSHGSAQTVEGCLQNSNGTFTLTDSSGTMYQLQGDSSKLTPHAGQEVRITGTTSAGSTSDTGSSETAAAGSGMPSSSGAQPMLTVQKVRQVSKTCNSNGMGK